MSEDIRTLDFSSDGMAHDVTQAQPVPPTGSDAIARAEIRAMVTKMQEEKSAQLLAIGIQPGSPELERDLAWNRWAKQISTEELRRLLALTADPIDKENPWRHIFMEIWRRLGKPNTKE